MNTLEKLKGTEIRYTAKITNIFRNIRILGDLKLNTKPNVSHRRRIRKWKTSYKKINNKISRLTQFPEYKTDN